VRWPGLSTSNRMRVWNRSEPMVIFQRNGTVLAGVARKRELHGGVQFELSTHLHKDTTMMATQNSCVDMGEERIGEAVLLSVAVCTHEAKRQAKSLSLALV
jgi:hypothetical protein